MSIDYTHDYEPHTLLENKNRYTELYKLSSVTSSDVHTGDLVLLKSSCGQYGVFVSLSEPDDDGTLHLSKYSEIEFIPFDSTPSL